ncbi:hypothetical protein BGZ51_004587 [Haplosporangium sp. Z 767]|nr:hypothetical protein BGZ51_004587 [Haplosporangium sp. Z 767]
MTKNTPLSSISSASIYLVALIPYAVYALFNALNYARINLMPESALALKIKSWTEQNHGQAMVLVAYVEIIGVMGTLVLQALTFQGSLLWPIAYAFFLRFRYFFSIHTRAAFAVLRARLDAKVVGNPKIPPKAIMAYEIARGAVIRFGMAAVNPPTASQ